MRFKCPHCEQKGISFRVKLLTAFEHDVRCGICSLGSRQVYGLMQSFVDQFVWLAIILGAVFLTFAQSAWLGLLAAFLVFMIWAGVGHLLAPLRTSHHSYHRGFHVGRLFARMKQFVRRSTS